MTAYDPERELSLADLAPERLTFYDTAYGGDGTRHEWRMHSDLELENLSSLRRIERDLKSAIALYTKDDVSDEQLDQAAQKLQAGLDAFLHLALPSLPVERLRAIPLRGKEHMLTWWRARQRTEPQEGATLPLAQAAPATPRGRRSRASSPATA